MNTAQLWLSLMCSATLLGQTASIHPRISPPPAPPNTPVEPNASRVQIKRHRAEEAAYKWAFNHLAEARDRLLSIPANRPIALGSDENTDWAILIQLQPPYYRESYFLLKKQSNGMHSLSYIFLLNGNLHWQLMNQKLKHYQLKSPDFKKIEATVGQVSQSDWASLNDFVEAISDSSIHIGQTCSSDPNAFSYAIEKFSFHGEKFTARISTSCNESDLVKCLNKYIPLLVQHLDLNYPECHFSQKASPYAN